jgi:hypothetical protein
MDMVCGRLPVGLRFMEGPPGGPSSGQAVEGFRGVAVVAGHLVEDEGFVGGRCRDRVA